MASKIEICNNALMECGVERINSLLEDSKNARLCTQFYPGTVDEMLRRFDFNCSKHTRVIAADASFDDTAFDFSYGYRYLLPSNPYCLKVRKFNDGNTKYDIQGRYIYSDDDSCELVYSKRITDTNEFDPLLAESIAIKLAIKLTFPLQQSPALRNQLIEYLNNEVLLRAKQADADETYIEEEKGTTSWRDTGR